MKVLNFCREFKYLLSSKDFPFSHPVGPDTGYRGTNPNLWTRCKFGYDLTRSENQTDFSPQTAK